MLSLVYVVIFDSLEELNQNREKFFDLGNIIILQDKNTVILDTKKFLDKTDLFKEVTHRLIDVDHYQIYNINEEQNNIHEDNKTLDDIIEFSKKRGLI